MDIFETLRDLLGCMFISDLRFGTNRERAIRLLMEIGADSKQMDDVRNYLGIEGGF